MSKKISEAQLTLLQSLNKQFNDTKMEIADLEIKKADLLSNVAAIKGKFAEQEKSLMKEFGKNAIINLQNGEVKDPEEEKEEEK